MITWEINGIQFVHRVAAVIVEEGRILVNRLEGMDFWFLPGGVVEIGEATEVALARELTEELTVASEIGRLLWVIENFFGASPRVHEVGLYYATQLRSLGEVWDGSGIYRTIDVEGITNEFQWWDVDRLSSLRFMPAFLQEPLRHLPSSTEHVVLTD